MKVRPRWLSIDDALQIHQSQIETTGGLPGVINLGGLESALARPKTLIVYAKPDIFDLAAAYTFGLIRNHCFVDGNKRTAFAAGVLFLRQNKIIVRPSKAAAPLIEDVASGDKRESDISAFYRATSTKPPRQRSGFAPFLIYPIWPIKRP